MTKIETLKREIYDLRRLYESTRKDSIKSLYEYELRSKLKEYEEERSKHRSCMRCGEPLHNIEKKLILSCDNIKVFYHISICKCGECNMIKEERVGNCIICKFSKGSECNLSSITRVG